MQSGVVPHVTRSRDVKTVVFRRVPDVRYNKLPKIRLAGQRPAPGPGRSQCRHQNGHQQGNDRDDYQQLNQSERFATIPNVEFRI
jgi:hypothetical protein